MSYQITNKTITELQTRIKKLESLPQEHLELMPQIAKELNELREVLDVKVKQEEWLKDTSKHATEAELCWVYRQ